MALKKGLGKGLDMLIPKEKKESGNKQEEQKKEIVAHSEQKEQMISIHLVEPNKDQPRKLFEKDSLYELAESIRQVGIIQPLIVQEKDGIYQIIAGERRWRAALEAGLTELPVIIRQYSEEKKLEIALIENIQRENLNAIEEAMAYKKLMTDYQLKQDEIADKVSKSRTAITNTMRLLKLDERVQQMIIEDMISSGHGRAILAEEDKEKQYQLALKAFDENLSVREVEKLVKKQDSPESTKEKKYDFIYREIEDRIKNIMGTKVVIKAKNQEKGKIELEYYSKEELERLVDLFEQLNG